MIVVDMLWIGLVADRADTALVAHELVELYRSYPVAAAQVVMTPAAIEPLTRLTTARVMAKLAIRRVAALRSAVARKVGQRLVLQTVGTPLHILNRTPGW